MGGNYGRSSGWSQYEEKSLIDPVLILGHRPEPVRPHDGRLGSVHMKWPHSVTCQPALRRAAVTPGCVDHAERASLLLLTTARAQNLPLSVFWAASRQLDFFLKKHLLYF